MGIRLITETRLANCAVRISYVIWKKSNRPTDRNILIGTLYVYKWAKKLVKELMPLSLKFSLKKDIAWTDNKVIRRVSNILIWIRLSP